MSVEYQGKFFFDFCADFGELGNLWLRQCGCCSLPWQFGCRSFPADFPVDGDFPGIWVRLGRSAVHWATAVETSKDVLRRFVGNSSARAKKHTCFMIARLGVSDFESSSHNPEVVGSNPAPATR